MAEKPKETAPAEAAPSQPVTMNDLLALVRELVSANRLDADRIAEISTKAAAEVFEKASGKFWDVAKFPGISALNPHGEKAEPRPELVGEVFWVGYLLQKDELTATEIGLLNRLAPGLYHEGQWRVVNLAPGMPNTRRLLVLFPCKEDDQRANLPRSMVEMLREMVEGVPALV